MNGSQISRIFCTQVFLLDCVAGFERGKELKESGLQRGGGVGHVCMNLHANDHSDTGVLFSAVFSAVFYSVQFWKNI